MIQNLYLFSNPNIDILFGFGCSFSSLYGIDGGIIGICSLKTLILSDS